METLEEESGRYRVVRSDAHQYAIWLAELDVPDGWRAVGTPAHKEICLQQIRQLGLETRPPSPQRHGTGG